MLWWLYSHLKSPEWIVWLRNLMHSSRQSLWYLCIKSPQPCASPTLTTLYWERLAPVACQYAFASVQRDCHPLVVTTVIAWLPLGSNCSIGPADYTPSTHNLWPCGRVLAKATFTWTKGIRLLSNKLCVRGGGLRGVGGFRRLSAAAECLYFNSRSVLGGVGGGGRL